MSAAKPYHRIRRYLAASFACAAILSIATVASAQDPFETSDDDLERIAEMKEDLERFESQHGLDQPQDDRQPGLLDLFEKIRESRKSKKRRTFADVADKLVQERNDLNHDTTQDDLHDVPASDIAADDEGARVESVEARPDRRSQAESRSAFLRAQELYDKGFHDDAEYFVDKSIFWNRSNTDALCLKGILQFDKGDYKQAVEYYDRALDIEPSAPLYNNRANAMLQLEMYKDADSDLQMALRMDPQLDVAHCNSGILYLKLGDLPQAMKHFDRALAITPDFTYAKCHRAVCLAKLGETQRATGELQRILEEYPHYQLANECLQEVRETASVPASSLSDAWDNVGGAPPKSQ